MHRDAAADPAGRRTVVGRVDLDAAIEVDRADAEAVIAKGLEGERLQRGLLLDKHRSDLALRRAVDTRIGPARVPVIEIGLAFLDRLEAHPLQWRFLRVADARFDFPFAIGIAHAAWQGDDAIVGQDVAIEWI